MIKVQAYTSGINTPSSIYRIRKYIKHLKIYEIEVDDYYPIIEKNADIPIIGNKYGYKKIFPIVIIWFLVKLLFRIPAIIRQHKYNILWLNRELLPGLVTLEPFLKKPYIFDFDDAIWLSKPYGKKSFKRIISEASYVVAGNEYLALEAKLYNDNVTVIPTSIDTDVIFPINKDNLKAKKITVGWVGTRVNFKYLYEIENELYEFMKDEQAVLKVVSSEKPNFKYLIENKHWYFEKWSLENENNFLNSFDIGIMPLSETPWEKGKCSFKMLQYMAVGIPVVASPVGMNNDIFRESNVGVLALKGEWCESLNNLKNYELRKTLGANARKLVQEKYSLYVNAKKYNDVFIKVMYEFAR